MELPPCREPARAHSLAWLEHPADNREASGSNPDGPISVASARIQSPKPPSPFAGRVAFEPPPNVMHPGRLPAKIRTGAKTASKDQERDFLERFRRLSEDPKPLLPEWRGSGPDPFARMRRKLERIQRRRASERWLRWYARGRKLPNAYASTLLVLRAGKIPSFASIKFQGRDVKFVLRGRGQQHKLAAIQNYQDPSVRLVGFVDMAKRGRVALVSLDDAFFAVPAGSPIDPQITRRILSDAEVVVDDDSGALACPHAGAAALRMEYEARDIGLRVRLCRQCVERLGGSLERRLERHVLGPGGRLEVQRSVGGRPYEVRPPSAADELGRAVQVASDEARRKSDDYVDVTDADLLQWTEEALIRGLQERAGGFLLVGSQLWLSDFPQAAQTYGATDLERRALEKAFALAPPRVRAGDASLTKLLSPTWKEHAVEILRHAGGEGLPERDLRALAERPPVDALPELQRRIQTQQRFREFPVYADLPLPLQLAYDMVKARRTQDAQLFHGALSAAVQRTESRSLALALARVFNASAGLEWQYSPHEKDSASFLEPYCRKLNLSPPETFDAAMTELATALGLAPPSRATSDPSRTG